MKPNLNEYEQGSTRWSGEHRGVSYRLNHHAVSPEWNPDGIWCFYVYLTEDLFINPEDFAQFDRTVEVKAFGEDSFYEYYEYYSLPDLPWHSGVTWYEKTQQLNRRTGKYQTKLEIGCDYNHVWDRDSGYWQDKADVEQDAKRVIDALHEKFKLTLRCAYSGMRDAPERFYIPRHGNGFVHVSQQHKFSETDCPNWLPKIEALAA